MQSDGETIPGNAAKGGHKPAEQERRKAMRTEVLFEDKRNKVVAVYVRDTLLYTRTYTYDSDGYVDKDVTVFNDGVVIERS